MLSLQSLSPLPHSLNFNCYVFLKTFLPDIVPLFPQSFRTTTFLDLRMWSTDTFWKLLDQSDMQPMSEQTRRDTESRGPQSSPQVLKCAPRRRWKWWSAAIGPITNSEVKGKDYLDFNLSSLNIFNFIHNINHLTFFFFFSSKHLLFVNREWSTSSNQWWIKWQSILKMQLQSPQIYMCFPKSYAWLLFAQTMLALNAAVPHPREVRLWAVIANDGYNWLVIKLNWTAASVAWDFKMSQINSACWR